MIAVISFLLVIGLMAGCVWVLESATRTSFNFRPMLDSPSSQYSCKDIDILYSNEKFYTSPSGKYKLITWNKNKVFCEGVLFDGSDEIKIRSDLDVMPFCWIEDIDGHDYLLYAHNRVSFSITDIKKKVSHFEDINCSTKATEIFLSQNKKYAAILATFDSGSIRKTDLLIIQINMDKTPKLNLLTSFLGLDYFNLEWKNDELFIITKSGYNHIKRKYLIELDSAERYDGQIQQKDLIRAEYDPVQNKVINVIPLTPEEKEIYVKSVK